MSQPSTLGCLRNWVMEFLITHGKANGKLIRFFYEDLRPPITANVMDLLF